MTVESIVIGDRSVPYRSCNRILQQDPETGSCNRIVQKNCFQEELLRREDLLRDQDLLRLRDAQDRCSTFPGCIRSLTMRCWDATEPPQLHKIAVGVQQTDAEDR